MKSKNQPFKLYKSVIAIALVAVSTVQLSSVVLSNGTAVYAYTNNQAQSFVNECGQDASTSPICVNNGPQSHADGTASTPFVSIPGGQGPRGPAGPQGEQGPAGPQGEQGPAGPEKELVVRTVKSDLSTMTPQNPSTEVKALCDSDEVVTGGGLVNDQHFGPMPDTNEINPSYNSRADEVDNGWQVEFFNPGLEIARTQAFAQCAKLVNAP